MIQWYKYIILYLSHCYSQAIKQHVCDYSVFGRIFTGENFGIILHIAHVQKEKSGGEGVPSGPLYEQEGRDEVIVLNVSREDKKKVGSLPPPPFSPEKEYFARKENCDIFSHFAPHSLNLPAPLCLVIELWTNLNCRDITDCLRINFNYGGIQCLFRN